ncbi:hypothetical protein BCR35DRAFT_72968 [Leucosporidium creatinivorum]|uniref:Uncharacterized protein n=1 Tax=Leucosporidium creatinivorum TaxID=106004 RepID=A0A1Y2G2P9_9BASI|nr:hypothetical protein BCR35DRAFT_72968 [Leucosporidium creatinivorum]
MPSYNLPTFPPPPPRPTSRRRPPPPPLNLGPSPFSPSSLTTLAAPTPLSPPSASMRRPFSSAWEPRRNYTRSPLGRSSSPFGARPQPCRPLSRRYVLPPLTTTAAPCQAFTTPLMGRDERGFTMYEEMVWKTLERRIREKVVRSRVGERAGLGVSAGREMLIWACLGSYREAREKGESSSRSWGGAAPSAELTFRRQFTVALAMAASMSAPPTRLTFIFPPPTSDRNQGARLARSIGHRKSQSTTGMTIASSAPPTRLGGVASRIRGFVARRTTPGVAGESEMKESLAEEAAAMRRIVEDYTDIIKSEFEEDSESEGDSDEEEVMVKIVMVEPERGPPPPPAPAIDISLEDFAAPSQTSSSDQVRSGTPIASSRAPYPDPQAGARPPPVPPRPKTPKRATTAPARLDEKVSFPQASTFSWTSADALLPLPGPSHPSEPPLDHASIASPRLPPSLVFELLDFIALLTLLGFDLFLLPIPSSTIHSDRPFPSRALQRDPSGSLVADCHLASSPALSHRNL